MSEANVGAGACAVEPETLAALLRRLPSAGAHEDMVRVVSYSVKTHEMGPTHQLVRRRLICAARI